MFSYSSQCALLCVKHAEVEEGKFRSWDVPGF